MHKWEHTAIYSRAFKAKTLAWYRLHNMVELHSEVAVQRETEKRSKRGRNRRR